jgi:hypothetical protein
MIIVVQDKAFWHVCTPREFLQSIYISKLVSRRASFDKASLAPNDIDQKYPVSSTYLLWRSFVFKHKAEFIALKYQPNAYKSGLINRESI